MSRSQERKTPRSSCLRGGPRLLRDGCRIRRRSPAWMSIATCTANPDRRRALFHLLWPAEPLRGDQEILVAGCGTSQAARYALREPDARITAIDISETSLRYTRDLQRKYDLENLDLHQLPIEDVQELGRTFDQIVCTGVLHHLPDPDLGLRALRDVLRPQGAMHLMVYAPYGRAGIYMMQEYCRLLGISSSDKDLRDLGATLEALPADHPIAQRDAGGEGLQASRRAGRCAAPSARSRLYRSAAVCLARALRHVVRALGRAGSVPGPMRDDGEDSARRTSRLASGAAAARRRRVVPRNDGQAQA